MAADAGIRLRELARCVADAEDRSLEAVWRDLSTPAVDTVSYRALHDTASITVAGGTHTVLAVRDLIVVCAQKALGEPAPTRRGTISGPIRTLLERSLLSLSDEPLVLEVALPMENGDPQSLARRTAMRMLRNATLVRRAAESSEVEVLEDLLRHRVSVDECIALAELAGPEYALPFELGFHWSWLAPEADETVEFPSGSGERIVHLSNKRVGQRTESGHGVVEGSVIGLSDDPDGARWRIKVRGTLEVDGILIDGLRTVAVSLDDDSTYAAALAAHRDRHTVRAAGAVSRHHRRNEIAVTAGGFTVDDHSQT
ncbi:hypothetical protein GZH49_32295 [Nocardia terpenica]|uniref:hypothetical protein n=1 Tax=Nocardia terpenica TaxID=455432 RepID=UPI002FE18A06